jgi:uncharacterized membrane-anchored protein YhcB (DUF1043 family)
MKPVWIAFSCGLVIGVFVGIWIMGLLEINKKPAPKIQKNKEVVDAKYF